MNSIVNQETAVPKKTLQTDVVRRFMSEQEFKNFELMYMKHRKSTGYRGDRTKGLREPVTTQEAAIVHDYLFEAHLAIKDLAVKHNISEKGFYFKIGRILARMAFQSPERFDL